MTLKKRFCITASTFAVLTLFVASLVMYMIHLSKIQNISVNGCGVDYTFEELINESTLIVRGKFNGDSGAFAVKPAGDASASVFTDYYFDVTDVVRGDVQSGDQIAVRIEGGYKNHMRVTSFYDFAPDDGSEAILFLKRVTVPGGYTTNEEYYIPAGVTTRCFYYLDESGDVPVYKCDTNGREPIEWDTQKNDIISLSDSIPMKTDTLIESEGLTVNTVDKSLYATRIN